jgi:hypothetical protein
LEAVRNSALPSPVVDQGKEYAEKVALGIFLLRLPFTRTRQRERHNLYNDWDKIQRHQTELTETGTRTYIVGKA